MEKLDWWGLKVTPWDDLIDARQIAERIEEISDCCWSQDGTEPLPESAWPGEARTEHRVLSELLAELPESAGRYGCTLIREPYFRDHIKEEYGEIGGELYEFSPDTYGYTRIPWDELMSRLPFSCIDWDAVAEECRSDYSIVEFLGTTYYYQEA